METQPRRTVSLPPTAEAIHYASSLCSLYLPSEDTEAPLARAYVAS